jgi:hypothetical protein
MGTVMFMLPILCFITAVEVSLNDRLLFSNSLHQTYHDALCSLLN